jgi:hypothetical protein
MSNNSSTQTDIKSETNTPASSEVKPTPKPGATPAPKPEATSIPKPGATPAPKPEAKPEATPEVSTEMKSTQETPKTEVLLPQKKGFFETLLFEGITVFGFTINYLLFFILFILLIVLYYLFVLTDSGKEVISATLSNISDTVSKTPTMVKEIIGNESK